jgi:hypothetical protein
MILVVLSICACIHSQDQEAGAYRALKEMAENRYGPDPGLINGEKYNYPYRAASGNPFLEVEGQDLAMVRIAGKDYAGQYVRYDVYGQLMVLDFTDVSGARTSIVLPQDHLERVFMGPREFKKYTLPDGSVRFGQVIHEGPVGCVCFWNKDYRVDLYGGQKNYYFTDPKSSRMIHTDGCYTSFGGNRSFLKALPETLRQPAREHLRSQKMKVRHLTDPGLKNLMDYINQLAENEK